MLVTLCLFADVNVVGTIAGDTNVVGVTLLQDKLCILRDEKSRIDIYSARDFTRLDRLNVPALQKPRDVVACECHNCLFIAQYNRKCLIKFLLDGSTTKWPLKNESCGVSLTSTGNVLTACTRQAGKGNKWSPPPLPVGHYILELDSDSGQCVHQIELNTDVVALQLLHSIQLTTDDFLTCLVPSSDHPTLRLGLFNVNGELTRRYNSPSCSAVGQLDYPCHLAVDRDSQFIFVADQCNARVVLLSPTLEFECYISDGMCSEPQRLHLDPVKQRLYVGLSDGHITILQL